MSCRCDCRRDESVFSQLEQNSVNQVAKEALDYKTILIENCNICNRPATGTTRILIIYQRWRSIMATMGRVSRVMSVCKKSCLRPLLYLQSLVQSRED